jgi:hypothetical protein
VVEEGIVIDGVGKDSLGGTEGEDDQKPADTRRKRGREVDNPPVVQGMFHYLIYLIDFRTAFGTYTK